MSAVPDRRVHAPTPASARRSGIQALGTAASQALSDARDFSSGELFVGREEELATLMKKWRGERATLITLVGTAGVGKTRLVRKFLELLNTETQCIYISLGGLSDDDNVDDCVAAACGVTPTGHDDIDRVCKRLAQRENRVVMVLDHAERLLGAVAELASELMSIDNLYLIVTSREPLGIPREEIHRLGPLCSSDGATLLQRLARRRGVSISTDDALDLAKALDGLPLAIELAAERSTILSPSHIQSRLRESNRVLESAKDDRHPSLEIAMTNAWSRLSDDERELCTKLAMFDQALNPETLEELWPDLDILMLGQSLVARSWISIVDDGEVRRWQMPHSLRSFVLDQSLELDRVAVEERLLECTLAHLERDPFWWAARTNEGIEALVILRKRNRNEEAAKLLIKIYLGGTYGFRTRTIFRHALELSRLLDPNKNRKVLCRIAVCISRLSMIFTSYGESPTEWATRAVDLAASPRDKVMTTCRLARALIDDGVREEALTKAREAFELLQQLEVHPSSRLEVASWTHDLSALFHAAGEHELSTKLSLDAYKLAQGNHTAQARCASQLALLHLDYGDFFACDEHLNRAYRLLAGALPAERAICLNVIPSMFAIVRGDLEGARSYLDETLATAQRMGNRGIQYHCDRGKAELAMAEQSDARPYLEHAYHELAVVDANQSAVREMGILLALNLIYEGAHATAIERIETILGEGPTRFVGDPLECEKMLRAALRFSASCLGKAVSIHSENAFEALVASALRSLSLRDIDVFAKAKAATSLRELTIPGFLMFRFEMHVLAWLKAEIGRAQQSLMRIERDGRHFSVDRQTYDFSKKAALRRMLVFLARCATERPDCAIDVHEVIRATWPGQKLAHGTGLNRAYTTVNRLRTTAGLGEHLESREEGYLIRPTLRVEWVDNVGHP